MEKENRKINLLVDGHFLSGLGQGTRTYIIGLYNAFINQYGSHYNIFVSGHNRDDIVNHLDIPHENFLQYNSESNFSRLLFELPTFISKNKIQFAHFQQVAPFYKNCKFITTVHDVLFNDYPEQFSTSFRLSRNFLFNKSIRKSEIKLTVSEYSKLRISENFNISESEIHVTPNGVNETYFQEYSKKSVKETLRNKYGLGEYVLFVSRLEPRKNHKNLLKAYLNSKMPEKGVYLVFVGRKTANVEVLDQVLNKISEGNKRHIHHYEYVDDDDLMEFYRGAELFVYPSLAEGFGIPPLEAAACKIPVLCSNKTAMSDFEKLGFFMFDPNDLDKLTDYLNRLITADLSNQNKLQSIKHLVKETYSWGRSAEILHNQIQKEAKKE